LRNKLIYSVLILFLSYNNIFSLIEKNAYNDVGLNEKNGTYGYDTYLRKSFFSFFTGLGFYPILPYKNTNSDEELYAEVGGRIKLFIDLPELQGLYFNGDFFISRNSLSLYKSGDLGWWNSFVPYFGNSHVGFQHKYFSIKLGFQNLTSSDAIYNHLLLDDYSGSIFALKINTMLGRFVDMEFIYGMVRPHQGPWYSGDATIDINKPDNIDDDEMYYAYYGKSLYTHKINIRPLPWIRFGIYEGVYFLGENFNPYYANPFFIYIATQFIASPFGDKEGSRYNNHAANLLAGVDFNIGFHGWRFYGEFFIDDFNLGEYLQFKDGSHPDKFAFILGGELRGYLFTRYIQMPPLAEFIISNLYFNIEYGIVSKYTYSRDSNFNYEYVRDEYKFRYDPDDPPSQKRVKEVNRVGNFLGFMYGPNSDCLDIAIGWRSDLFNVKEYNAGYAGDEYFYSLKNKQIPKRLIKLQLHYRHYRLGDERDVIMPYYWNEHPSYDLETGEEKSTLGTSRGTEFLTQVHEIGDILDLNIYGDVVRFSRFVLGLETKFMWQWITYYPFTSDSETLFMFKWDFGIILSW